MIRKYENKKYFLCYDYFEGKILFVCENRLNDMCGDRKTYSKINIDSEGFISTITEERILTETEINNNLTSITGV